MSKADVARAIQKLKKDEEDKLKKLILEVVEDSSGGLKFTELLVKLMLKGGIFESPEELERIVRETKGVRVLDYVWHREKREKMFIYTP